MKKIIFIILISVFAGIACQQPKQPEQSPENYHAETKEKITEMNKLYFEAWENEDLDSVMTFLDEGFVNMFGFNATQTKEQCREPFKNVFDTYSVEGVKFKSVELIVDKNYAFETGFFKQKWISNDKQDTISFDMRGMTVYKKQEGGNWKMFRLIAQQ